MSMLLILLVEVEGVMSAGQRSLNHMLQKKMGLTEEEERHQGTT